jgi:FixJ family two-component response regulator
MDASARICIVDDDVLVRRALGRVCRLSGYAVVMFASAEDFLEATAEDKTDCLILDIHLPGRSGLQLQQQLQVAGKRVPIVFVTAYEDSQKRKQAIESGAVDFLAKPLDNDRLLQVIHMALHPPED